MSGAGKKSVVDTTVHVLDQSDSEIDLLEKEIDEFELEPVTSTKYEPVKPKKTPTTKKKEVETAVKAPRTKKKINLKKSKEKLLPAPLIQPEDEEIFDKYWKTKPVVVSRMYNFAELSLGGVDLVKFVEPFEWKSFFHIKETVYPLLVQAFYYNAKLFPEKDLITSNIKDVELVVDPYVIGSLIGIKSEGLEVYGNDWYDQVKINKVNSFEEENHMLREQMTTMQTEIEKLTSMVASLMATQNQVSAPAPQSSNALVSPPISSAPLGAPQFVMPEGYPWGMLVGFLGAESRPVIFEIPHVQSTVPIPQLVNTLPQVDDLQIKYDEIQREMRALRGKDLFGQDAHELCLVPDVVVPHKFKVPDFEKYKGSTCPKAHLIMYARKMSTQTSNDKLLIHYFQDSLTGAALRWYMDLDRANVSSFNDLASAFIRQYNYNSYLAPNRDELRALTQKESESFKEYAQRWRELAAQNRPPVEEKELCKLFLHTLSPFFYEKMVGVVSRSFTEMVEMGMCLEEGVRQGRLTREKVPINAAKRYDNNFSERKESEVGMVAQGGPHSRNSAYQHIAAIALPPQYPQSHHLPSPQRSFNHNRVQKNQTFDPIPVKYADLLPALLAKNFVQTRPPPPVPAVLPPWYRSDLTCVFHQGAPGHDVERCYPLKKAVQDLVRNKVLSFKDENPNVQSSSSA
ncbi:hypothetical protein TSUD_277960 [Trifolium subterraneum]|uniref:Retrotransposon gag domain-containing protein n=1 Tax=Trifolium subterraneum TaxID=3900 RepID=A0A2Z6MHT7_TRISU|nr:hypothetical protein TSUD_277960 [Trifolium subterraneum]